MKTLDFTRYVVFSEVCNSLLFIEVRWELIKHLWKIGDGTGKEELACDIMDTYVDRGVAQKLDPLTDSDGQKYHRFFFPKFKGVTVNYTRHVPFSAEGQTGAEYDALVARYEDPENFLFILCNVSRIGTKEEEYLKTGEEPEWCECEDDCSVQI